MCPNCGRPYGKRRRCYYCNGKGIKGRCLVPGCNETHEAKGFCGKHYQRFKQYGNPLAFHPNAKGGYTRKDGYKVIYPNGVVQLEHRLVMEQVLGRPLCPNEVVHHLNGNRADNRPENLALMVNSTHGKHHGGRPRNRVVLTCRICGAEYERPIHRATTSTTCSQACQIKAMHEGIAKARETHTWGKWQRKRPKS